MTLLSAIALTLVSAVSVPAGAAQPARSEQPGRPAESVRQVVEDVAALIDGGQLARARERISGALRQFPSSAAVRNLAGIIDAREGAYASAERHFRAAIDADSRMTSAYLNLGRLYQEQAPVDPAATGKALDVYQQLLRVDPANTEALFQAGYLSATAADWRQSREFVARLPSVIRERPQALGVLVVNAAALGERATAEALAQKLLEHPDLTDEDLRALLPALHRLKDDALMMRLFAGLDARGLAAAESLRQLGLAYARQNRPGDARATLERAVQSAGAARVPILLDVARVAYKQFDFEGALRYLAQARDLDAKSAEVHFMFGLACIGLNLGSEAYESLKKAVTLTPDNPYVNYAMGAVSIHRHEPSEALPYFEAYVRLQPGDPRGRFALGAARFYSNDFDGARSDLQLATRSAETAAGAHYFLARIARQLDEIDRAGEEIQRALALNPEHADGWAELGLLRTRAGEYAAAEESLKRALSLDPENYAATVNLATLYARTKDPRREEQMARLDALQKKRAVAAQEFLRIVQVVQ